MSRRRRVSRRGPAPADLTTFWPLDLAASTPAPDPPADQQPLRRDPATPRTVAILETTSADTYFCKACRRGVRAELPPEGWVRLQERQGEKERASSRLYVTRGVFCGLPCLALWAAAETERTR